MCRVVVCEELKDSTIELLTNNFDRSAATVSEPYKKCRDIALFFKSLKQHLQIKTYTGTSEQAVRPQHAFSNFTERIRMYQSYYLSLDYVCNSISQGAKKVAKCLNQAGLFCGENTGIQSNTAVPSTAIGAIRINCSDGCGSMIAVFHFMMSK